MNIDAKMPMPDLYIYKSLKSMNYKSMFLFAVSRRKWYSNLKAQMEKLNEKKTLYGLEKRRYLPYFGSD